MERAYKILFLVIIPEIIATYDDPLLIGINNTTDYCVFTSCSNLIAHTGCAYSANLNRLGDGCDKASQIFSIRLHNWEKIEIVERHNEIRQYVAAGKETRGNPGPQPPAVFMPNLTWDDELADLAQRWANQCPHSEDHCRDVERFRVGQNIAFSQYFYTIPEMESEVVHLVNLWYNQSQWFNNSNVHNYLTDGRSKEYAQMIWANTTTIGCGRIRYQVPYSINILLLICNYGPAGSLENQKVYEAIELES